MNVATLKPDTQSIVIDEIFPHPPEAMWKALTNGILLGKWLMVPTGFQPVVGNRFTFQTTPAGEWNGVIHCEVLEVVPFERLAFAWKGGHESNVGYGSRLDTVITFTLSRTPDGVRLRFVHSGFDPAKNAHSFKNMSEGWKQVVQKIASVAADCS
jgi:uncharacterized protein YndB with AHSA1/START domain